MGRSQTSFGKKEREKKKAKKRREKEARREERKENNMKGDGLDNMIGYVDEFGNPTDTPPDPEDIKVKAEDIVVGVPPKDSVEEDPIKKGKVEYFDHSKGFGFIRDNTSGEKYFFHISETVETVDESDRVSFEIEKGPRGLNAVRVKKG